MKTVSHNERTVTFSEEDHIYKLDTGEFLKSGTGFVHGFFKKFDSEKISYGYAKKHGLDQQQVLAMWREKGERASNFGTNCHAFAEHSILSGPEVVPSNVDEQQAFHIIARAIKAMSKNLTFVGSEVIIFSPGMGVAGTVDLIGVHKETGEVWILDWKTNEKIERENKFGTHALPPIEDLPDCNFVHYCLQLSLYHHIIEGEGFFPDATGFRRALIHINQNKFEWIPVPYFDQDIKKMLLAFKKRRGQR